MSDILVKSRIRVNINRDTGDVIFILGDESEILTDTKIDAIHALLNRGKVDSKEIKISLRKIKGILKSYNSIGKVLEENETKIVEEDSSLCADLHETNR